MSSSRSPIIVTGYPALAKTVTPSDSNSLTDYQGNVRSQSVFVGVAGDVRVLPVGNTGTNYVTFTCPAGSFVPVEVTKVLSTGTTASGLVGVW